MNNTLSIGNYLLKRIQDLNVNHIFGVPGDFVLSFNKLIESSPISFINTCDEQGAGYAADAYARIHGFGVVCITYCVGGLKVCNTTAEAWAENSPVLVISGAPGLSEQENNPMLHHKVNTFDTQKKIFDELTIASASIKSPETAIAEIDRVIDAITKYKLPGYIELPRDLVSVPGTQNYNYIAPTPNTSNQQALEEAVAEASRLFENAKKPIILAGVEIHRHQLQDELIELAKAHHIPIATTILGKSVISEQQELYAGVYMGSLANEAVQKAVESSDCLLVLGAFMTDMNLGIFTGQFNKKQTIMANFNRTNIGYHHYEQVFLKDFINNLSKEKLKKKTTFALPKKLAQPQPFKAEKNKAITIKRVFDCLNTILDKNHMVVADVGDSLFGSMALQTQSRTEFMSPAYYASIGFSVPAAIGAQTAKPTVRPIVIVGDGAFQMTGMEISTLVRFKLNPIIILLNNKGYGTERPMLDGQFNDVLNWNYHKLPEVFGHGKGFLIKTETELEAAIQLALKHTESYCLLEINLDQFDFSPALQKLTAELGSKV